MKKIIAAVGMESESQLTDKHFGDSVFFDIYEITGKSDSQIKRIKNVKAEERMHGDPKKANTIGSILSEAEVLVAFRMGPNILRMKKRFVPVIVNSRDIKKVRGMLIKNYNKILKEVENPGEKNYITLKIEEEHYGEKS